MFQRRYFVCHFYNNKLQVIIRMPPFYKIRKKWWPHTSIVVFSHFAFEKKYTNKNVPHKQNLTKTEN